MPHTFIVFSFVRDVNGGGYQTLQVMKAEWRTVFVAESIACIAQGMLWDDGSVLVSSHVEVKFTLEQAMKAQRRSKGILSVFL